MGLADLLKNNFRLKQLYTNENTPHIQGLQMNEDGSVRQVDIPNEIKPSLTSRIADLMLGKKVQATDTIDTPQYDSAGNATINTTINNTPRTGGWLRDIAEGYKENRDTPISLGNFSPDTNKNWATRLGEGLGTVARFADSPLGRSALVGAAVGLTGGNGLQALTYGTSTGALNQRNRMADELYRDDLASQGIDIDNIRGYITNDAYKDLLASKQLKDDAEWRKTYFDTNQKNLEAQRDWQRQQYEMNRADKAADRAFQYYNANLNHNDRLAALEANAKKKGNNSKVQTFLKDKTDALAQISALKNLIKSNPNAIGLIVGSNAKGNVLQQSLINNFSNKNSIRTRAAISKLRGTTMHDLAGTAQTLQEQKNLAPFLPDLTDNAKTALAKLAQLESELGREVTSAYASNMIDEDLYNNFNNSPTSATGGGRAF